MTSLTSSRLGSAAKGDYHPTYIEAVRHIARILKPDIGCNVLDPSCGKGIALATLAREWGTQYPYGNEIEKDRYESAKETLGEFAFAQVTLGAQETLEVHHDIATGGFEIIFINPPYNDGAITRLEHEHVEQATKWLARGGVMVAVLPQSLLKTPAFWRMWLSKLNNTIIAKMIGKDYDRFHQFILIGRDKYAWSGHNSAHYPISDSQVKTRAESFQTEEPDYPAIDQLPPLNWRISSVTLNKVEIKNRVPSAAELLEAMANFPDVFDTREYKALTTVPQTQKQARPIMACRAGHVVQLAAAGAIRGMPVELDDGPYLVTSHWYKYLVVTEVKEKDDSTRTVETEKTAYQIFCFSKKTGMLRIIDSRANQEEYEAFVTKHTKDLMNAVDQAHPPMYDWDYSHHKHRFDMLHSPRKLPGVADGMFIAQKHTAAALVDQMRRKNGYPNTILVGECGTGKTFVSAGVMAILSRLLDDKNGKVVVLCPALVAPKWAEEAKAILRDVPNLKVVLVGEEHKQRRVTPFRANGIEHGLQIVDYRGLRAKRYAGHSLTSPEAERLASIYEVAEEISSNTSRKGRKELEEKGKVLIPTYKAKHAKTRMTIRDLRAAMDHDGPAIAIINYEVAKFGSPWEHIMIGKKQHFKWTTQKETRNWRGEVSGYEDEEHEGDLTTYHCPTCGEKLIKETGLPWTCGDDKEDEFCTNSQKQVKRWCPHCNAALWQATPFSYGGRWPACEFLGQHYAGKYTLIIDEAHNTKGGTTNIGCASQDAVSGARHTVAMTGTICNGYAGSLFYLFYRLSPLFRTMYAHDEVEVFKHHHGYLEIVTTERHARRTSSAYGYTTEDSSTYQHEAPGVSPVIISMMVPMTVWLRKSDLDIELPSRTEFAVPALLSNCEPLRAGYRRLRQQESKCKSAFAAGNRAPLANYYYASLGWLDAPVHEVIPDVCTLTGVPLPEGGYPKDRILTNLILKEHSEGRGVAVFFEQVQKRDARHRVRDLLAKENIYAAILKNSTNGGPKAEARMPWILEQYKECQCRGQPMALLANGALLNEGIDLLFCPTIVEVGQHQNITKLLQRLERSHRIGQTLDVRLYFLFYKHTEQEAALKHIATKLRAAKQVDGEHAAGIAAFEMDENDFVQALIKEAQTVERTDISTLMQIATFDDRPPPRILAQPKVELHKSVADLPQPEIAFATISVTGKDGSTVEQFCMF